jgi:uncharacterized membrane-anchored protein
MSRHLAIAAVALQALVLAYMAGEREWVLRKGRTIYLRTAPIDPRDAMRGDYVRLSYEISRVPRELRRGGLTKAEKVRPDTRVYASLRENEEGLAELVSLSDQRPAEGLFIRGRAEQWWGGEEMRVRYGVEAYFMGHEQAKAMEKSRERGGIQVPLEMAVAVRGDGLAVIKGHRWCALGIGLELERERRAATPRDGRGGALLAAKVRLMNASANDLAVVDLPGGRSLALVPDAQWGEPTRRWASENQPVPEPKAENVVVLKPAQIHTIRVDFKAPSWFVVEKLKKPGQAKPRSVAELSQEWLARFRLEYRPASRAACADLPNANLIWHGRLPSRSFTPAGAVD